MSAVCGTSASRHVDRGDIFEMFIDDMQSLLIHRRSVLFACTIRSSYINHVAVSAGQTTQVWFTPGRKSVENMGRRKAWDGRGKVRDGVAPQVAGVQGSSPRIFWSK